MNSTSAQKPADAVSRATGYLERQIGRKPRIGLILGSGLAGLAERIDQAKVLPFAEIPGFPLATVAGHASRVVSGRLGGADVVALQGRFHLYEGWSPEQVVVPVRSLAALGMRVLVVTNAAGGTRPGVEPGSLMLIADHLNFMFRNPLIGPVAPGEQRFPDMSEPYDPDLRREAIATALQLRIPLFQGTYAAVLGPSYETPAEVRMLARCGADAIGMSTVPEVVTARALDIPVVGFSVITNAAAGLTPSKLTHAEVLAVGAAAGRRLGGLIEALVPRISTAPGPFLQ